MPDIPGTSRAQTLFLRAFRKSPTGPTPDQWPSPAILRRWRRKPTMNSASPSTPSVPDLKSSSLSITLPA